MIDLRVSDMFNFLESKVQPSSYVIAGVITDELASAEDSLNKKLFSEQSESILESMLGDVDWSHGYSGPMVIFCDERLTSTGLTQIHKYLRTKSTNIENICLVTTHHLGIADWWNNWKKLYRQKSFSVVEWMHCNSYMWKWFYKDTFLMDKSSIIQSKSKIDYLFSYYGGDTYVDRCYMVLKMLGVNQDNIGMVDFDGKYFLGLNEIVNDVEYMTYFQNQQEVDKITELYNQHCINNNLTLEFNNIVKGHETIDYQGFQWSVDKRSFLSVVRETHNRDVFSCVTEKTLRAFLHFCVVIPVNYQAVDYLEAKGFWFPHDLIDYDYQNKESLVDRMNGIIEQIQKIKSEFSNADLEIYFQKNIDKFYQNAKLVLDIKKQFY